MRQCDWPYSFTGGQLINNTPKCCACCIWRENDASGLMVVDASALILKSNYRKDMVRETVKELHCCAEASVIFRRKVGLNTQEREQTELQELYLEKCVGARGQHAALEPGLPAKNKRGREKALFLGPGEWNWHATCFTGLLDSWLTSLLYIGLFWYLREREIAAGKLT